MNVLAVSMIGRRGMFCKANFTECMYASCFSGMRSFQQASECDEVDLA